MLLKLFKKYSNYNIVSVAIILISIFVTFMIWIISLNYYNNLSKEKFEYIANENIDNLYNRISTYKNVLISSSALVYANNNISNKTWHDFIQSLNIKKNYPGFQGIGYSPFLHFNELSLFIKKMQVKENPSFSIYPIGKREIYVPIQFIEPITKRNIKAIGFDLYSENKRKKVLNSAINSGLASTSDKVTLVQEMDTDIQAGILMYVPVYKNNYNNSVEEKKNQLLALLVVFLEWMI